MSTASPSSTRVTLLASEESVGSHLNYYIYSSGCTQNHVIFAGRPSRAKNFKAR